MTLEHASHLSQTIAALAVIVSLIYAAMQFRIYAKAAREARMIATTSDIQAFRHLIASDPDCARIYRDGLADLDKLDSTDQWRFGALMQMLVSNAFYVSEFDDVFGAHVSVGTFMTEICRRPGFRRWWVLGRRFFAPATVTMIDGIVGNAEAA